MKVISDSETTDWLEQFIPESDHFDWDEGNLDKNLKHGVRWEDVESIFLNEIVFEGQIIEPSHPERRYLLLGKDGHDRFEKGA